MEQVVYWFSSLASLFVDVLTWPVKNFDPSWGLYVVSLVSGVILLLIYGRVSNQNLIRNVKKNIHAALLEAILYRHDIGVSLKAQGRMLAYGAWYFLIAIPPLVVLIVPCLFLLAQLNVRYGYEPLSAGSKAILSLKVEDPKQLYRVELKASDGLSVTPPLRIRESNEIIWRIEPQTLHSASKAATVTVSLGDSGKQYTRTIALSPALGPEAAVPIHVKSSKNWLTQLLYPDFSIEALKDQIAEVSVSYPERHIPFFGIGTHWIIIFLVLSLASGLFAAKMFRIEI